MKFGYNIFMNINFVNCVLKSIKLFNCVFLFVCMSKLIFGMFVSSSIFRSASCNRDVIARLFILFVFNVFFWMFFCVFIIVCVIFFCFVYVMYMFNIGF